jgi:hypothetical protein
VSWNWQIVTRLSTEKPGEADLFITKYFPEGFWVAEFGDEVVGFAYGYFNQIPEDILER